MEIHELIRTEDTAILEAWERRLAEVPGDARDVSSDERRAVLESIARELGPPATDGREGPDGSRGPLLDKDPTELLALREVVLEQWFGKGQVATREVARSLAAMNRAIDRRLLAAWQRERDTARLLAASAGPHDGHDGSDRDRFLALLAHELRTPLQAVRLQGALVARVSSLRVARDLGKRVRRTAKRLGRMVEELLDLARFHAGRPLTVRLSPLDLQAIAQQSLEEVAPLVTRNPVRVEARGDTRGEWDEDRLKQVVVNLIANAATYSNPGLPIEVVVSGEAPEFVDLVVADHGRGIAAERLSHLFEPYEGGGGGATAPSGSLGLGLFIVDLVVRAHGGRVLVESQERRGTTVRVRLPRAAACRDEGACVGAPRAASSGERHC